jgi:hypothetical protein
LATVVTKAPTNNTGSAWTNPDYAYLDDANRATLTSGSPSGSNSWDTFGFSDINSVSQVRIRTDAYSAAPAGNPTYRSTGTMAHSTTTNITPGMPGSMSSGDVVFLIACCYTGGTLSISANGSISTWNAMSGSPVDVTAGDKLYVWWGVFSSGTTAPTIAGSSPNHMVARMIAFYNVNTTSPIDVYNTGSEATSDTSFSFATGLTSTYDNEISVCVCTTTYDPISDSTSAFGTMTNGNLSSISERMDNDVNEGNGGGFGLDHGLRAVAGAIGTWASTLAYSSPKAYMAWVLKAVQYPQLKVDASYDGGTNWSAVGTFTMTSSEATNWYDVTATGWDNSKLSDANLRVRVLAQTVSGDYQISLDYIAVEVTGSFNTTATASTIIGDLISASRLKNAICNASVLLGDLISASRLSDVIRNASTLLGNLVSASKIRGITRKTDDLRTPRSWN